MKRRAHRDPVTPELREYVLARDKGCLGPRLEMEGPCVGRIELDHVMGAGLGRRGPSVASNLASLCAAHHFLKTSNARTWRPVLVEYLHGVESHAA
jgi:hypothetical protein